MNIFVLDFDQEKCAKFHNDDHCIKMLLETAQLLCTAQHVLGVNDKLSFLYKKTHENHPCSVWVRKSLKNYEWLCKLGLELCREFRYRRGKKHKSEKLIKSLCKHKPKNISDIGLTEFALAMPDYCKMNQLLTKNHETFVDYTVASYRNYYLKEKQHIAYWSKRRTPKWFKTNN